MGKKRLNSNALELIGRLQRKEMTGEQLSPHQRKVIVKYFYEEDSSWSNSAIGQLIAVTPQHASHIKGMLKRIGLWEVEAINIEIIALDLYKRKMEYQRKAVDKEDFALAWRIEIEFVGKMQDLGFIYKAPQEHLIGNMMLDAESKMLDYFKTRGVPNVDEFIRQLSGSNGDGGEAGHGNGDGDGDVPIPVLALPSPRESGTKVGD
jgi:hypothetical protein